jgi:flagellar basal-body rod protein FlgB
MSYFDNLTTTLLSKNLDGLWLRQQVIMENVANRSTPNYKSKYVDFENELKNKIADINGKNKAVKASELRNELATANVILGENADKTMRLDGNNVDVEKENLEMARTQFNYNYTVAQLNSYFAKMKMAISSTK